MRALSVSGAVRVVVLTLATEPIVTSGRAYFLGFPPWGFLGWKGRYFTEKPFRLASYAQVFNTVEGNTTFYRTPDANTVERWRDACQSACKTDQVRGGNSVQN
jgi:hypothetical protein